MHIKNIIPLLYFLSVYCMVVNAEDFDNGYTANDINSYYPYSNIPNDILKINEYANSCNISMSSFFLGNHYSFSKGEVTEIINEKCKPLMNSIKSIKLKYENNEKLTQLLSMAEDTNKIYCNYIK
ncbi:hypothetical protein K3R08_003576 [Escherichia albertii]|nr:hypothetical protein [Escherichia albertii]